MHIILCMYVHQKLAVEAKAQKLKGSILLSRMMKICCYAIKAKAQELKGSISFKLKP